MPSNGVSSAIEAEAITNTEENENMALHAGKPVPLFYGDVASNQKTWLLNFGYGYNLSGNPTSAVSKITAAASTAAQNDDMTAADATQLSQDVTNNSGLFKTYSSQGDVDAAADTLNAALTSSSNDYEPAASEPVKEYYQSFAEPATNSTLIAYNPLANLAALSNGEQIAVLDPRYIHATSVGSKLGNYVGR